MGSLRLSGLRQPVWTTLRPEQPRLTRAWSSSNRDVPSEGQLLTNAADAERVSHSYEQDSQTLRCVAELSRS